MRKASLIIGISVALAVSLSGAVLADDTAKAPVTGSTKPHLGNGPAEEKSLPPSAPPASRTQTTGSGDQSKTVKAMNSEAKARADTEGK